MCEVTLAPVEVCDGVRLVPLLLNPAVSDKITVDEWRFLFQLTQENKKDIFAQRFVKIG